SCWAVNVKTVWPQTNLTRQSATSFQPLRLCESGRARRRRESLCPLVLLTKPPPLSIRLRRAPPASSLCHRTTRSCHRQLPVSPIWTRRVPRPMANSPPFAISRGISLRGVGSYKLLLFFLSDYVASSSCWSGVVPPGLVVVAVAATYKGYRYPIEVIGHAVWLYHRFALSLRDV